MRMGRWMVGAAALVGVSAATMGEPIVMREALAVGQVGSGGRSPIVTDAVAALFAGGEWATPSENDLVTLGTGFRQQWKRIEANEAGLFEHGALYGGYALWRFESDDERVMMLEAAGHSMVRVNGVARAGDLYEYGNIRIPVAIRKGANELLFLCGRGRLRATLTEPEAPVFLDAGNVTLPDLLATGAPDDGGSKWGAITVINATESALDGAEIVCEAGGERTRTAVPAMLPLSVYKAPFETPAVNGEAGATVACSVSIVHGGASAEPEKFTLRVCTPDGPNVRTFRSRIDGSVQYYAERPAIGDEKAVILTLHGAGVEARGQSAVYAPKEWARIVAPTNRGRFGFDWEDWGRIDAMEVLELVSKDRKAILTGHSMGGHGSWQLASHYPDRFVAVGPSAGWVSFASYSDVPTLRAFGAAGRILERAAAPSDTLALKRNFYNLPAYILHGSEDDNVPLEQATTMRHELEGISPGLTLHSQLGAGHWWGNECCDWPEMMAFFKSRLDEQAGAPERVRFTTVNPGISAWCEWVTIEQQAEALSPSAVDLTRDLEAGRVTGTAKNIERFTIDLSAFAGEAVTLVIDEDTVETDAGAASVTLVMGRRGWEEDDEARPEEKGPHRNGPFKAAFDHDAVLVYGTKGDEEENRWALERARYDAEVFFARGNGALRAMSDDAYLKSGHSGNVILYGHAGSNGAWDAVLGTACPIRVDRGRLILENQKVIQGDDLGVMFCYPVAGSDDRLAGVVAPTGSSGGVMLDRQLLFVSGVHYPDVWVLRSAALQTGHKAIVGAGFFGNDWSMKRGDFVWTE